MGVLDELYAITETTSPQAVAKVLCAPFYSINRQATSLTDLYSTARRVGAVVKQCHGVPFEGRYRREGGIDEIVLRPNGNKKRMAFTLAHEIGHLLVARTLARRSNVAYRSGGPASILEEEKVANAVAAELLMPARSFAMVINEYGVSFRGLDHAQRVFQASFSAVLRRISEVTRRRVLFLNVIPKNLFDINERCTVDDASLVIPDDEMRDCRESSTILSAPRFIDLKRVRESWLCVRTPVGQVRSLFEIRVKRLPCHNADLLATF